MAKTQSVVASWLLSIAIVAVIIVLVVGGMSGVLSAVSAPAENPESNVSGASGSVARKQEKAESFEQKIQDYVTTAYSTTSGLKKISADELHYLAGEICSDLEAGGDGKLYLSDSVSNPDEATVDLAIALNYAYATNVECTLKSDDSIDNFVRQYVSILAIQGKDAALEWGMLELDSQPYDYGNRHGQELYQYLGGNSVRCRDGSISKSGGKQGACSWHGGVAE